MSVLRDLPISKKFGVAFGAVCLLTAALGTASLMALIKVNASVGDIVKNALPSIEVLGDIRYSVSTIRRTDALLLLCSNDECTKRLTPKRKNYIASYNAAIQKYAPLVSLPGERTLYETIVQNSKAYIALSERSRQLAEAGNSADAAQLLLFGDAVKTYNGAVDAVEADVALNNRMGGEEGAQTLQLGRSMQILAGIVIAISVLLCAIIGMVLTRLIVPPVKAATDALERLAAKDLTAQVEVSSQDEMGRLSQAVNDCGEVVRNVLQSVAKSADTLSASATELSIQSQQTCGNIQQQSGKINQIAAAAQEMTATIGEISQNAETASAAGRNSAENAAQSGMVMQSAAITMERISTATSSVAEKISRLDHRSQEIGKVVTVIQEISEQTNLLALNAAIEAARAGEHGRGFAVVAGEVRRLAERTKGATEEISATIRSIQNETRETLDVMAHSREAVQAGISETANARNSLESIIASAKDMEMQIHLIATAATEQTAASGEISESANEISNLAMTSSQAAEETAEASKNLSALANDLDAILHQFKMGEDAQRGSKLKIAKKVGSFAAARRVAS